MSRQTLSQRRAKFALDRVQGLSNDTFAADFKSYAASLPAMIQMNGFGQALAFCRGKRGEGEPKNDKARAYGALYDLVSEWLTMEGQPYGAHDGSAGFGDLLDGVTRSDMSTYRLAQTEALALLDWVKRFASAFIASRNGAKTASPPDAEPGAP